jgi:hypothetical protein
MPIILLPFPYTAIPMSFGVPSLVILSHSSLVAPAGERRRNYRVRHFPFAGRSHRLPGLRNAPFLRRGRRPQRRPSLSGQPIPSGAAFARPSRISRHPLSLSCGPAKDVMIVHWAVTPTRKPSRWWIGDTARLIMVASGMGTLYLELQQMSPCKFHWRTGRRAAVRRASAVH